MAGRTGNKQAQRAGVEGRMMLREREKAGRERCAFTIRSELLLWLNPWHRLFSTPESLQVYYCI